MSTVVAQPYSTAGNGGRKLVRLRSGWLFAVTKSGTSTFHLHKSVDNGTNWSQVVAQGMSGLVDVAIATDGEKVFVLRSDSSSVICSTYDSNGNLIAGPKSTDYSQSATGNVSLAINPQGTELHAAWTSMTPNSSYSNSYNIRYIKGMINVDGSISWGEIEQVTVFSSTGSHFKSAAVGIINNVPYIITTSIDFYLSGSLWKGVDPGISGVTILKRNKTLMNNSVVDSRWSYTTLYNTGTGRYAQSSPSAVVDKDGVIHVAWHGKDSSDNITDNIRYSKSVDGGVTWSAPVKLTKGNTLYNYFPSITVDKNNAISVLWRGQTPAGSVRYDIYHITSNNGVWSAITKLTESITGGSMSNPSTMYDPTFSGTFGAIPPTIYEDGAKGAVEYIGTYRTNSAPSLNVTSPTDNQTLYENDTLNIAGTVSDADVGNTVTVRYQIGAGTVRAIKAFISTGTTESYSKELRFSGGNLYDGDTLIASNLTDGVAHTLKVWATDDQGGTSPITERTFYVVPNRAPSLAVNTPVISGNIDNDEFEITGSYNDLDKNTTTVAYRINGGSSVQVAEGTGGHFNFKVKFGQLKVGLNSIVIEAIDSYGAKTSRTIKLNKNEVQTEQLKSTARFKIHPPLTTATGIVLWVRRDENLALTASISMTQATEAENFVQMENPRTSPIVNTPGVVEDQFEYESATAADKIILQLDMQRSSLTANEKIYLLVGVID